jgi:hypothetical protein
MFTYHFLHPEQMWAVFDPAGYFVAMFETAAQASDYCARHNAKVTK